MARYWVTGPHEFSRANDPAPLTYRPRFKVIYLGADVPGGISDERLIEIEPTFTNTPAQVAAQLVDMVVNDAASIGLVVARADGLIPSYLRGT